MPPKSKILFQTSFKESVMHMHNRSFFWFLLFGVLFAPILYVAFPCSAADIILIQSVSAAGIEETPKPEGDIWRVESEAHSTDAGKTLLFFRQGSDNPICSIVLSESGMIKDTDIPGVNPNMMIREDDLLLVPGYPVPCDMLPFYQMHVTAPDGQPAASREYQIKRSAGTQTFVDKIKIYIDPVPYETARANGWIKYTTEGESPEGLKVIKVINPETAELLAMQVWADHDNWWLYEKTRFRHSWRINLK